MELYRPLSADNLTKQWWTMGNYQSLSRTVTDVMLDQWKCMVSPFRVGIQMMDALLVPFKSSNVASGSKDASGLATQAEAASLEKPAMERLKSGHAAPREIDDAARWTGIHRNYTSNAPSPGAGPKSCGNCCTPSRTFTPWGR